MFLEQLVLRLLVKMGYGGLETPAEHLGAPGDAGLDGLIRLDPLGLDVGHEKLPGDGQIAARWRP